MEEKTADNSWLPSGEKLDFLLDEAKKYIDGKEDPPLLVERYYTKIETPELTYLVHTNHLIVVCLPLNLKGQFKVDFGDLKVVTGKKKSGAKLMNQESIICFLNDGDETKKIRCGIKHAKLIEVNMRLADEGVDMSCALDDGRERAQWQADHFLAIL